MLIEYPAGNETADTFETLPYSLLLTYSTTARV
jgi:hypothetical protein